MYGVVYASVCCQANVRLCMLEVLSREPALQELRVVHRVFTAYSRPRPGHSIRAVRALDLPPASGSSRAAGTAGRRSIGKARRDHRRAAWACYFHCLRRKGRRRSLQR